MRPVAEDNREAVLRLLAEHSDRGGLSRNDICQHTGLSYVSSRRWMLKLVAAGLAHVCGYRTPSEGGKPPELYRPGKAPPNLHLVKPKPLRPRKANERMLEIYRQRREAQASVDLHPVGYAPRHYITAALFGAAA